MNEELPERDLLRTIDPAPHALTPQQQERHLRVVQARIHRARPARRTRVLLVPALLGAAAAALAAALVLPATSSPGGPRTPAAGPTQDADERPDALAVGSITRSGVRIVAAARVRDAVFLLGSRGDDVRLAATFDGSDPDRDWERVEPRPAMGATEVRLFSAANFPVAAPGGVAQAAGWAGADVTALDIRTRTAVHEATVTGGYWLAAWSGHDFDDADDLPVSVTVHLRDGSSTTTSYRRLSER